MKYLFLFLFLLCGLCRAEVFVSTTGSTLGLLNLSTAAVTDEHKLLVLSNGRVQELGASVWLLVKNDTLYAETQGGAFYSVNTLTLIVDQNGTLGFLLTPTQSFTLKSDFSVRFSPSPSIVLDDGVFYAPLPNASGAASVLDDNGTIYAEDGNNTLYLESPNKSSTVGRSSTQGNIQSMAVIGETPEPSTLDLLLSVVMLGTLAVIGKQAAFSRCS